MQLGKGGNYCFRFYYYSSFREFLLFQLQHPLLMIPFSGSFYVGREQYLEYNIYI